MDDFAFSELSGPQLKESMSSSMLHLSGGCLAQNFFSSIPPTFPSFSSASALGTFYSAGQNVPKAGNCSINQSWRKSWYKRLHCTLCAEGKLMDK